MQGLNRRRMRLIAVFVVAAASVSLGVAGAAGAPAPESLTRIGGESGAAAGQLGNPVGMVSDPATGHLFVADRSNNRIDEFTVWGEFVRAWGWGVADGVTAAPQTCTSSCFAGIAGPGAGQLDAPNGLGLAPGGDVYVFEKNNSRIQKFSPTGAFELVSGGDVNKTKVEEGKSQAERDVCTAISGDVCGAGSSGSGPGEFLIENVLGVGGDYIDVGPDGTLFVADKGRIQEFEPSGDFKAEFDLPLDRNPGGLAVDPASGRIYFAFSQEEAISSAELIPDVYEFEADGTFAGKLSVEAPGGPIAVDADGDVYVVSDPLGFGPPEDEPMVLEFDSGGALVIGPEQHFATPEAEDSKLNGLATNAVGDIYASSHFLRVTPFQELAQIDIFGPPPTAIEQPPAVPPTIADEFAVSVGPDAASVRAAVNPHFWDDAKYFVEFGTASCSVATCAPRPSPPGVPIGTKVVNSPVTGPPIVLEGLQPATTYHYRFVAQSGGGGPVVGPDRTFKTPPLTPPQPPCPANQSFRTGAGARLADCRAYEMVSPVDKKGANLEVVFTDLGDRAGLDQAEAGGDKITFSAYRAFGDVESSPYTSQYIASRVAGAGWSTQAISPPRNGPSIYNSKGLDSQYKAFSTDLCGGWLVQDSDLSLAPGSVAGFPNLYRRENCAGGYEALTTVSPPEIEPRELLLELQGTSADGTRAFFRSNDVLASGGAKGKEQLYEAHEGSLSLVCVRPSGAASKVACSAGTPPFTNGANGRNADVDHAISTDGSVIYWSEASGGPGKIFVRVEGAETFNVSAGTSAQFLTAAADGSKALYSEGPKLFEFDLATHASTLVAEGFDGLLGASDDLSRIYLASSKALAPGATAGKPNIYLDRVGSGFTFIAALSPDDLSPSAYSPVSLSPLHHVSQTTPDGGTIVFLSNARPGPTGFDNTDANSGTADAEVYLYDAEAGGGAGALRCVSCLASGARPLGRNIQKKANLSASYWAAAKIPTAETQLYAPRVLTDDGTRLFFESFDALVDADTNGKQDVYEWEAQGTGNCAPAAPGFDADLGGCLSLISSGEDPADSELVDSSADGRDVFFKTEASLVQGDPDLIDIYDARADGGLPSPPSPPAECEGESCQHPGAAPSDPPPASSGPGGPENPPPPVTCRKGTHRVLKNGFGHCVKNKKPKKKRHHGATRHHKTGRGAR
jgi:hypothetical protein